MDELKPCKCGGIAEIERMDFHDNYFYVYCTECDEYMQPVFTKEEAIISWNCIQ